MSTKIALISDSHSYIDHKTLTYLQDADQIWHAGDIGDDSVMKALPPGKPVRAVFGNIDDAATQQEYPEWQEFTLENVKVLMTHIGGKPPRYAKGIKARIKESAPQLFICGHSHICKVQFDSALNCLYMNPGAIGQQGFHTMRTMLLFELDAGQVKNLRVVELGKRGKLNV
ncbi:metallophosphoesterase family protein [Algoriphagus halophytocola]|uniref:metallophosphoesterase family protein n=1 Tax=Algoriphagus halophytocola TaxID=2991499 RepID=UPI0022DDCA24|nr:metallophosphoesterase family protein [Algoriphagus sp. TR-M9]WBL43661.1 metallophosphoesterase family protein [Algoriphagus sp. TR-M9]